MKFRQSTILTILILFTSSVIGYCAQIISPLKPIQLKPSNIITVALSGGDYKTVNDAVNKAVFGNIVYVYPGITNRLYIPKPGVRVIFVDALQSTDDIIVVEKGTSVDTIEKAYEQSLDGLKKIIVIPNITVGSSGCNYTTLGDAMTNAAVGDIIYIKSGTYNEAFTVNKSVQIIGENSNTTKFVYSGMCNINANVGIANITIDLFTSNVTFGETLQTNSNIFAYNIKLYSVYDGLSVDMDYVGSTHIHLVNSYIESKVCGAFSCYNDNNNSWIFENTTFKCTDKVTNNAAIKNFGGNSNTILAKYCTFISSPTPEVGTDYPGAVVTGITGKFISCYFLSDLSKVDNVTDASVICHSGGKQFFINCVADIVYKNIAGIPHITTATNDCYVYNLKTYSGTLVTQGSINYLQGVN